MAELTFTPEFLAALRKEYAQDATEEQFTLWIEECKLRGLMPNRDVVLQIRNVKEWDPDIRQKVNKKRAIYITTIGALRKIAQRTGEYLGQLPPQWIYRIGGEFVTSDTPLPKSEDSDIPLIPWACKVSVIRKGFPNPIVGQARFKAYAQTYRDGDAVKLNSTWSTRGPEQLAKCSESDAMRRAFAELFSGLYLNEEIRNETEDHDEEPEAKTPVAVVTPPAPTTAPAVNHTPSIPTDEPRPGEKKKVRSKKGSNESNDVGNAVNDPSNGSAGGSASTPDTPESAPVEAQAQPESNPPATDDSQQAPESGAAPEEAATDVEPVLVVSGDPKRLPTPEEKKVIATFIKSLNADSNSLKDFILKRAEVKSTNDMTVAHWNLGLQPLKEALVKGGVQAAQAKLKG